MTILVDRTNFTRHSQKQSRISLLAIFGSSNTYTYIHIRRIVYRVRTKSKTTIEKTWTIDEERVEENTASRADSATEGKEKSRGGWAGGVGRGERNAKEQRCTRAMGERKGELGRWDRDTK